MMLHIGHVPHGDYRKSYQLRCFFWGARCQCHIEVDINSHKQNVGPSSYENADGHVSETIEDRMDVDDARSMDHGTFSNSSLYILDHSLGCNPFFSFFFSFFFFSLHLFLLTGEQPSFDLASPTTIETSDTHRESESLFSSSWI